MPDDLRYCRHCGYEITLGSMFCESCGHKLGPAVAGSADPSDDDPTARRLARERERAAWREQGKDERRVPFLARAEGTQGSARGGSASAAGSPASLMLFVLLAWIVFRTFGYLPLVLLLELLAFLMRPKGLLVLLMLAYAYSRRQREIDAYLRILVQRVGAFRRAAAEAGRSLSWVRQGIEQVARQLLQSVRGQATRSRDDERMADDAPPDL